MPTRRSGRAYTIAELLVVVAVILILATILLVGADMTYTSALRLQCQHRMEQIGHACSMYAARNLGMFPPPWGSLEQKPWYEILPNSGCLENGDVIGCPSSDVEPTLGGGSVAPVELTETQEALFDGLRWLSVTQDPAPNGAKRWNRTRYSGDSNYHDRCTANGVTGLCLLAFLGAGINDTHSEFGETVKLAAKYLASADAQDKSTGYFRASDTSSSQDSNYYTHGICTMAVAEASRMISDPTIRSDLENAATLATGLLAANQHSTGGYNYTGASSDHRTDTSVSSWCYQGLGTAIKYGYSVSSENLDRAEQWLARVKESDGTSGYAQETLGNITSDIREFRMTPAALTCRLLLGHQPTAQDCLSQANWIWNNAPHTPQEYMFRGGENGQGSPAAFVQQVYYIYYMSLAMFMMGDQGEKKYWSDWEAAYIPALLAAKTVPSEGRAYWSGDKDDWLGGYMTRDAVTALACISLEMSIANYLPGSKWFDPGRHSYGYNNLLGQDRRAPAADTIILLDYERWGVSTGDPAEYIIPAHGGRANVLFGDGHVEALRPEEFTSATGQIKPSLLTPAGDTEDIPSEEGE